MNLVHNGQFRAALAGLAFATAECSSASSPSSDAPQWAAAKQRVVDEF